jgi:hypothetical protein
MTHLYRLSRLSRLVAALSALGAFFLLLQSLHSQVLVDLSIKRSLYIAYEPLLATVRITNLSGNTLLLADVEGKKWFGFQIETLDGRPIPPRDPNYEIEPIKLGSGESISRTVNLTQLYPLSDFGSYRIRASVYAAELSNYFSSPPLTVEITEGRLLWEQTVGVPGMEGMKSSTRTISLLSERLSDRTDLYLRIQDKEAGIIYCTHRLGDYITFGKPEIMLDSSNTIHVLQNNIPREFIYSKVGLDGKILDRVTLNAPKERPQLQLTPDGNVVVIGGIPFDPRATRTPNPIPKLSDRPVPLPMEQSSSTPSPIGHGTPAPKPTPRHGTAPKALPSPHTSPSPAIKID